MRQQARVLRQLLFFLVSGLALGAGPATAAPIALSYSGVIEFVDDPDGLLDPAVSLGAPFTADLTFDPATATPGRSSRGTDYYTTPAPVLSISIGATTLTQVFTGLIIDDDSSLETPPIDFWGSVIEVTGPGFYIPFVYTDVTATRLSDESFFVPSDSDFTGWTEVAFRIYYHDRGDPAWLATGTIFAIPETGTGTLFLLGLLQLAMMRRNCSYKGLGSKDDGSSSSLA